MYLRYGKDLVFPGRLIEEAGNVYGGKGFTQGCQAFGASPDKKKTLPQEKFNLHLGSRWTDMILEHNTTEDALRGLLTLHMLQIYRSLLMRLVRSYCKMGMRG